MKAGRAKDIADGVLFRALNDLTKISERKKKVEEEQEERRFSLLDQIPSLPTERAIILLEAEIARIDEDLKKHKSVLRGVQRAAKVKETSEVHESGS